MEIGNRNKFAVKVEFASKVVSNGGNSVFGKSILYINNHAVGNWEDENLIGVLVGQLVDMAENSFYSENLSQISSNELIQIFELRDKYPEYGLSICNLAENFDSYFISYFKTPNKITFIWRESSAKDPMKNTKIGIVLLSDFKSVVYQLQKTFNEEIQTLQL